MSGDTLAPGTFLCRIDEIPEGNGHSVTLGTGRDQRRVFVLRFGQTLLAYENLCPHAGTPLNWLPDRFLSRDGSHLHCATHGAEFRIHDGYCVKGPCQGRSLRPIRIARDGDLIRIADD